MLYSCEGNLFSLKAKAKETQSQPGPRSSAGRVFSLPAPATSQAFAVPTVVFHR